MIKGSESQEVIINDLHMISRTSLNTYSPSDPRSSDYVTAAGDFSIRTDMIDRMSIGDFVTIKKSEYESLLDSDKKLRALEDAGVDNWHFYDDAMEAYRSDEA